MALKGSIAPGSAVDVRLSTAANNSVPAELIAGYGVPGSQPNTATVTVRPGDSGELTLQTGHDGTLRIHVHLAGRRGVGTLEVRVDGEVRDAETVLGDTWWFYVIKDAEGADYAVHGQHQTGE